MKSKSNKFFTPNDFSNKTTFDKLVLNVDKPMVEKRIIGERNRYVRQTFKIMNTDTPLYFRNCRLHELFSKLPISVQSETKSRTRSSCPS
jgi:hypothetical protein